MDFSVRNKYIKKFMSNYSTNNGLKLIKYLTIIGIDAVRKLHKPPITYETIQKLAKSISSPASQKEEKSLKKEILSLKNDVLKLTEKLEMEMKTPSHDTSKESFCSDKSKSKKVTKAGVNTQPKKSTAKSNTKPAAQGARTNRKELSPSPLKAKEKAQTNTAPPKRSKSSEGNNQPAQPDWWQENCRLEPKVKKEQKEITPKITQIEAPALPQKHEVPRIRNHLDDQMMKDILYDANLPESNPKSTKAKKEAETLKKQFNFNSQPRNHNEVHSHFNNKPHPAQFTPSNLYSPQNANLKTQKTDEYLSPNFRNTEKADSVTTSDFNGNNFYDIENKENQSRNARAPLPHANRPVSGNNSKFQMHNETPIQPQIFYNIESKQTRDTTQATTPTNGFSRKATATNSQANRQVLNQTSHSGRYDHVKSKLREDANFQRDISRNSYYKKRLEEFSQPSEEVSADEAFTSGRSGEAFTSGRSQEFFANTFNQNQATTVFEKEENRTLPYRNFKEDYSNRANANSDRDGSCLLDSQSSVAHKPIRRTEQDNKTPPSYYVGKTRKVGYITEEKSNNVSQTKSQNEDQMHNILDIANSFLNSPLMQHLSSQEFKGTDEFSSKDPHSYPNTLNPSQVNISEFDTKSPDGLAGTSSQRRNGPNETKIGGTFYNRGESNRRFSDWAGSCDFSKSGDNSTSILKDSTNRRQNGFHPKDSGNGQTNGQSSLSSSYFSNFNVNEDMKGFYQNVFWEQNTRSRDNSANRGQKGSGLTSDNSSNISFNAENFNANFQPESSMETYSKKEKEGTGLVSENSKSFAPMNSIDNPFKQFGMGVTHILSNNP